MTAATADRAGAHVIVDFPGHEITPPLERLVREGRIGGVILFAKNIRNPAQVRTLTADLQRLAAAAGLPPLFITIDQEGGVVNRLSEGCTVFPGAMALAAGGRAEDAEAAARITALELRALGINTNHAPVLDVNTNPANPVIGIRAFGDEPDLVARFGVAYLRGAQSGGILATAKHFPGHGDTALDSHLELPTVTKPLSRLRREELAPFVQAVRAGADALLSAHVVFPALDAARPATLSRRVMHDLLRSELGFDGVVFTDSMEMKAIADRWSRGAAAVEALRAGCDLLLACGPAAGQWAALDALRAALDDGTLAVELLRVSEARLERVRRRYLVGGSPVGGEVFVGRSEHRRLAQEIADRTVTLVRNGGGIPLPEGRTVVLSAGGPGESSAEQVAAALGDALAALRPDVTVARTPDEAAVGDWAAVVVASLSLRRLDGVETVRALHRAHGRRLVVVGVGSPYELRAFPEVETYLATYGPDLPSLRAAAKVLAGSLVPSGRLPVALPGLHPRGWSATARA
ncbi:MAG TPA: beta-N-acetylhexosaminidase [bacterium]|nr:beta-N-acetylhexosaminidase [bacterium]